MKSLSEAAKRYQGINPGDIVEYRGNGCCVTAEDIKSGSDREIDAFKAGAIYERKRSEILVKCLEDATESFRYNGADVFKRALQKYKESEGGGG